MGKCRSLGKKKRRLHLWLNNQLTPLTILSDNLGIIKKSMPISGC